MKGSVGARALERKPGDCGVDEAGRGPLAGPVVVAAVILPDGDVPPFDDSKKLPPSVREEMARWLRDHAACAVEIVSAAEIDASNILRASLDGMARAADRLTGWGSAWLDGHLVPSELFGRAQAVVKGDGRILEIAAASILAKATRDEIMRRLGEEHPGYGFERHFGYPTKAHLAALRELGPCPEHRRSFAPVRAVLTARDVEVAK